MDEPSSHQIPEQDAAYRRGLVLGLTMAEVGILIIFVLLLLIGFHELLRERQAIAMAGRAVVERGRLQELEVSHALVQQLRTVMRIPPTATPDEVTRLVRVLLEVAKKPEARIALDEARTAIEIWRRTREQIVNAGGTTELARAVEQQSYRLANQEGQLRRYEIALMEVGLGKGERPCWVKPDGSIEYLYDVVLGSDGIRMREYRHEGRVHERSLLPMPKVSPDEVLSIGEFLRRTEPLFRYSEAANCRYFVVVYDDTGPTEKERYKELLRAVEGHFYKRLERGAAPF